MIGTVEHDHYYHNLSLRHAAVSVIIPFSVITRLCESSATEHGIKNFAEFICHYEYFCNFVFGEHSDKSISLYFSTINLMLLSLIAKIFNHLIFVELTLNNELLSDNDYELF